MTPAEMLVAQAQQMLDHERRLVQIEAAQAAIPHIINEVEGIKDRLDDKDFLSVETWCKSQRITEGIRSTALRIKWGKECSERSREHGIEIKNALDESHAPGRYHISILRAVCKPKPTTLKRQLPLLGSGE